jgi:hypothetical protein
LWQADATDSGNPSASARLACPVSSILKVTEEAPSSAHLRFNLFERVGFAPADLISRRRDLLHQLGVRQNLKRFLQRIKVLSAHQHNGASTRIEPGGTVLA